MSRRVALVVNPTSGRGRGARNAPVVRRVLKDAGLDVTEFVPASAADVIATLRRVRDLQPDAVVVVGGDGSVHLAAQQLADTPIVIGVIPSGSGNDFARALGIPVEPGAAADVVAGGQVREIDLIRAGASWVTGVAAAGFDARVNERANAIRFPRGGSRYTVATLAELRAFRPIRYTLDLDGTRIETEAMLVAVGNTASYGGGRQICHGALIDDGRLDVTVIKPVSRLTLVRLFPKLTSGSHVGHPAVQAMRGTSVRVAAEGVTAYADGERLGPLPIRFDIAPGALWVYSATRSPGRIGSHSLTA